MTRRVVILSRPGWFVRRLLGGLHARGVRVSALVLYDTEPARDASTDRSLGARFPRPVRRLVRRTRSRLRARFEHELRVGSARRVVTGVLNGREMASDLARLAPDVLVLAHCDLVHPRILAIPREGVVNVHPALLPWIRGNSPIVHSILRGIPLGSSAFWVDEGIDTGRLIERRLLPVSGGETFESLREALLALWVEMTVDLVAAACAGCIPPGSPQAERFPLCRNTREPEIFADVRGRIGQGAARELFERWRPLCGARLALPIDMEPELLPHAEA